MTRGSDPSSDRTREPADVAPILKGFGVLKKDPDDEVPLDKSAADAFLDAMQDDEKVARCVTQLFPNAIPLDQTFFDQLDEFHRWIGVADSGDEAIGLVWSEAMRRLSPEQQHELLQVFARQDSHRFFENVGSLRIVMRDHVFSAAFLAEWFVELLRVIEQDMAQDGVWKSIRTVCSHVDTAIETLKMYFNEPDKRRCSVAGFMLGVLRSEALDEKQAAEFARIENEFQESEEYQLRTVFNWSWVTTARDRELTQDELNTLISRADNSPEDLNNLVCVICRLITIECLPDGLVQKCRHWTSETVGSTLSGEAKFSVVMAAHRLQRGDNGATSEEESWVLAIQPVAADEVDTWDRIGDFLCDVLKRDVDDFTTMFVELCATSASTIHGLMAKRSMRHFLHELGNADVSTLAATLALSFDTPTRQLGLFLLDELEISQLHETVIASSDSDAPKLLFYEAQRTILKPATIARILAALVPTAEKATDAFRDEFFDELKLQCHNFSGGCRQELEAIAKDEPLVAKALGEVADYFDALKKAHEAGINAMEVAGFRKAAREQRRLFNKQVSEGAKSASPLLSMMKHVTLMYGRASSQFIDGTLRDAMPLAHTSTSMEIPIVDFCDPEEMALRRLRASTMISQLLHEDDEESEVPSE